MALAEPLSLNPGSGAVSLPRVAGGGPTSSQYTSADGTLSVYVTQSIGKDTINSMIRVDKYVIAADPISTANRSLVGSIWTVFKFPIKNFGFTEADKVSLYAGLNSTLTASTNTILKQILAAQH